MDYLPRICHSTLAIPSLTLALSLCVSAHAKPKADDSTRVFATVVQTKNTAGRYQDEIDNLSREIDTDKAHRTALVTRMDDVRQKLDTLRLEEDREHHKQPSLETGIESINKDLANLEEQLRQSKTKLVKRKKTAENQPMPSLLEDALGATAAIEKHRAIAMQNYLLYKARIDIQRSTEKQQQLKARKVALMQTSEILLDTLGEYQSNVVKLTELRTSLELQFTDLSTVIVQKQDRLEQFSRRLQAAQSRPQQTMFSKHQGDLRDPTAGVIQHRYAEPKAQGLLKWEGILIAAPQGQNIEAVFDGTVIFADHMQGLGDVAILDHGEGYMSLYGMADFLVVEQGQQVLGGDTIGIVGGLTENDESTLYFEIRHNASTVNPEKWLGLKSISQDNEP